MKLRYLLLLVLIIFITSTAYARWIKDKAYIETADYGQVEFSHYNHLDAVGSDCPTCHNDIFHIVAKKNPSYSMAEMAKGKSCGACHNGKRAFSTEGDCATCHAGDVAMSDPISGKTMFPHQTHLDMDFTCDTCHPDLFAAKLNGNRMTMRAMNNGEYCGACHDGDTAFSVKSDCTSCHAGDLKWANEDAGETSFPHQAHLDMDFTCDTCHPDLFKPVHKGNNMTMDAMYEGEYCGACHDGDTAFSVEEDCESCHNM
ncbi:MAG: hypothetical protein C0623_07445 [Desulfuromonas sp.]|nr:MAG: hypothetical protein C0623_07445 [Desulfuromonas sp.]